MDTRVRVARGIAKTETEASVEVFQTLKRRGHPDAPPPTMSDGWGGIDDAMVEVYGIVPGENGRVVGVELRVIYGDEEEVLALFGKSTAYVERTHLTMRLFNSRLARKTLAFSKLLEMYRASAAWEDLVYNLARALKTLRVEVFNDPNRRWKPRTPAMAAGLTDHIWTVKELLTTVVLPNNT